MVMYIVLLCHRILPMHYNVVISYISWCAMLESRTAMKIRKRSRAPLDILHHPKTNHIMWWLIHVYTCSCMIAIDPLRQNKNYDTMQTSLSSRQVATRAKVH